MKIINTEQGEAYQLAPDTQLTVERTNPFFNEYAEQTVPFQIPASPRNCRLTGNPEAVGNREKERLFNVSVQDGSYSAECRQAVLSAQRHGQISTSLYLNDGSLYARLGETRLKAIWTGEHEYVEKNGGLQGLIDWCRQMAQDANYDPRYTIFPVLVDDDSESDNYPVNYKVLNNWSVVAAPGGPAFPWPFYAGTRDFYNAVDRTEYVKGKTVNSPAGYWISPFIRVKYVLERIFASIGYTLQSSMLTATAPFSTMAIINNCIDTLIPERVYNADLVPDITCKEFLTWIRKKFCCEFVSNEADHTVSIQFLSEALAATATDLTQQMTEEPTFEYGNQESYKRITLKAKDELDADPDAENKGFDSIEEIVRDFPTVEYDEATGQFFRTGYTGYYYSPTVKQFIAADITSYGANDPEEEEEVEIPECLPQMRLLSSGAWTYNAQLPYIGKYNTKHSTVRTAEGEEESEGSSCEQRLMVAFSYDSGTGTAGTMSGYNFQGTELIYNYSLYYWGDRGIFERFWRPMDKLYRNALNNTKVKLLLSNEQKQLLPATGKVMIRNEEFFLNKLKFALGGKNEPMESELFSLTLREPVTEAKSLSGMLPMNQTTYKWEFHYQELSDEQTFWEEPETDPDPIFPPVPSAEYVGQQYGHRVIWYQGLEVCIETWLECVPK